MKPRKIIVIKEVWTDRTIKDIHVYETFKTHNETYQVKQIQVVVKEKKNG